MSTLTTKVEALLIGLCAASFAPGCAIHRHQSQVETTSQQLDLPRDGLLQASFNKTVAEVNGVKNVNFTLDFAAYQAVYGVYNFSLTTEQGTRTWSISTTRDFSRDKLRIEIPNDFIELSVSVTPQADSAKNSVSPIKIDRAAIDKLREG